jgi:peptidoglycan L-alanyl-D-glutamate endopeptidase CwlK
MTFAFGARSLKRLEGVHPALVRVLQRAISLAERDFTVVEGLRTLARQKQLVRAGASQTIRSRHITGHAVDIAPLVGGVVRWDWPLFYPLAETVKEAARLEGVPIEWGGDWTSLKDGPHWQLPWRDYP